MKATCVILIQPKIILYSPHCTPKKLLHPCSKRLFVMCGRRRHKVHSGSHLQSSIQGFDRRQIRQSRAFARGDTGPQTPPRDATSLQRRFLS